MALSRKLARGFMLLVAAAMGGMLVLAVLKGVLQKDQRSRVESEPSDSEMKISEMEYVEMQEGRKFYVLKASEARYLQDRQKAILKTVRLTFFMEDGQEAFLNSEEGVFSPTTKNIELTQAVEAILPGGYRLTTDRAVYEHEKKTLSSETPIAFSGPDIQLKGGAWRFLIPERKGQVDGGVKAQVKLLPAGAGKVSGR